LLKLGLTGGIASGKSVVGEMLVKRGVHLIQSDAVAHALMDPGRAVYEEVVRRFGREILNPDGTVNRSRLAEAAFGTPGGVPPRVQELNEIVHPAVITHENEWMEEIRQRDPNAIAISPKHATLSTSGIVPGIERLGREKMRPKLAISLNASSDEQRDKIMPINRKYPLEKLLDACRSYPLRPWEHLTFEYVLLGGFNDSPDDARRVVRLLANLRAKVNLIPWNPGDLPYEKPDMKRVAEFKAILTDKDLPAFVRASRGQDVMAACGQLALVESAAGTLLTARI